MIFTIILSKGEAMTQTTPYRRWHTSFLLNAMKELEDYADMCRRSAEQYKDFDQDSPHKKDLEITQEVCHKGAQALRGVVDEMGIKI